MFVVIIATATGARTLYPIDEAVSRKAFDEAAADPDTIFACYGEYGCDVASMANVFVSPATGFSA